MARPDAGGSKYPPSEFSQKYAPVLAPKGKLLTPKVGVYEYEIAALFIYLTNTCKGKICLFQLTSQSKANLPCVGCRLTMCHSTYS